jgi:GNAT superfamily N-acetyltransferase
MDEIKVIPVTSNKDLNHFIKLPWKLYKGYPNWVPPLISERKKILNKEKNPFFKHAEMELFIAWRGNEAVGRIAAIKNELHNKYNNDNAGFFGFFECINDQNVANLLFDEAAKWIKSKGLTAILGPANPSSNDDWGMLIEGYDKPPTFMMPYNPEYYLSLCDNYGFTKAKDLVAYLLSNPKVVKTEKLFKLANVIRDRYKIKIKELNLKDYVNDLAKVKYVYNKAWAPNWGFVPLTNEEIDVLAEELKSVVEPSLVLFAEIDDQTVGFTLTMPDLNFIFKKMNGRIFPFGFLRFFTEKKKINLCRILTLGIIPEYQKKGIDALLYYEIVNRAEQLGIMYGEGSWILEDNEMMNNAMKNIGGEIYKKYRIYQINL